MIKEELASLLTEAVEAAGFPADQVVETLTRSSFGDYSSTIAFKLGKAKASNQPGESAKKIVAELKNNGLLEKAEVVGSGFINLFVSKEALQEEVKKITESRDSYFKLSNNKGKKARVEFISANPTGPLHLGNARGGPIGDVLAKVLEESGYQVLREYVHNDVGGQVEKLGHSIFHYIKLSQNIPTQIPSDGYSGEYIEEIAKESLKAFGKEIIEADEDEAINKLAKFALDILFDENLIVIEKMGIDIDEIFNESDFLNLGQTKEILRVLEEKKVTKEKDGAVWFAPNDEYLEDREAVLVRSNGQPTYFANDIAYHNLKFNSKPDLVIDIFGSNHHGHVPKLKAAVATLGFDPELLKVILYQYVRLKKGDDIVKMSKRAGNYVTAEEVLNQVGKDVFRFFLLQRAAETHMDFDLDLATKQSQENPVFYIQYAYARMSNILKKANFEESEGFDTGLLKEEAEMALIKKLLQLPELVAEISKTFAVHQLTSYSQELADSFHHFYESTRVIVEERQLSQARLNLVFAAKIVLGRALYLMGVSAPERM